MSDLIDVNEVAKLMGYSPDTIRRYCRDGSIPYRRSPGGTYRFLRSDYEQPNDSGSSAPPAPPSPSGRKDF